MIACGDVPVEVAQQLEAIETFLMSEQTLPSYEFESLKQELQKIHNLPVVGISPTLKKRCV